MARMRSSAWAAVASGTSRSNAAWSALRGLVDGEEAAAVGWGIAIAGFAAGGVGVAPVDTAGGSTRATGSAGAPAAGARGFAFGSSDPKSNHPNTATAAIATRLETTLRESRAI